MLPTGLEVARSLWDGVAKPICVAMAGALGLCTQGLGLPTPRAARCNQQKAAETEGLQEGAQQRPSGDQCAPQSLLTVRDRQS